MQKFVELSESRGGVTHKKMVIHLMNGRTGTAQEMRTAEGDKRSAVFQLRIY